MLNLETLIKTKLKIRLIFSLPFFLRSDSSFDCPFPVASLGKLMEASDRVHYFSNSDFLPGHINQKYPPCLSTRKNSITLAPRRFLIFDFKRKN